LNPNSSLSYPLEIINSTFLKVWFDFFVFDKWYSNLGPWWC
jgi:hypothetical protein